MEGRVDSKNNRFLKLNAEKQEYNQYWFSEKTIAFIVNQIESVYNSLDEEIKKDYKIAIVACPSVFFSLSKEIQGVSYLFDIDEKLTKKHKNGVVYDFNKYEEIVEDYKKSFDFILIDPPFIVKEAWEKFAIFAKEIQKEKCKILTCSIFENSSMLKELLNLEIREYQPSIPHLVYQYNFYSNYDNDELNKKNSELI
jgi:hypothetical protein